MRVFNNSPSRDRSWCTVLTGGVKKALFSGFSGGRKCPPPGGEKSAPLGAPFPTPQKGSKKTPKRGPKRPPNDPLFDPHLAIWATLRWLSLPSLAKRARYTTHLHFRCHSNVVPTQRVIDDATPLMLIEDAASIPRLGVDYNLYVMMSTAHRTMDTIEAAIAICTVGA